MSDKKKAFWFIALLSTLVIIPFLGETIFYSKGEPREAIVAYSMLESGNWILPLNYGTDIAYKPPFLYWSIAAISAIFGGVSEFSSRLPSAIAFLAMQFVFFGFVARYKNTKTAVITSLLLLTSFEVHRAAVACRLDMLQVSFIVISLCLLFRWDEKGCKGIPWTAVVLMACGTLTKGPVGSIFPCMCIGIYQLIRGRSFGKTFLSLFGIGLLSLIPLGIWFYAAWLQGGQPFMDLMLEENTGRFVGKMSYPSHHNPLWYNFLTIIWGWIPWTLVLLISLFGLKWNEMHLLPAGNSFTGRIRKVWDNIRSQSPIQLFIWIVIIAIFVFYCIPKSKRSVYLLPIYPFMAVLIAQYLEALMQKGAKVILAVKSDKHLAEDIRKQVPEGVVYSYTDRMIRFYCTNYYMNNQMRNFTLENPQEGYVILSANAQEEFLKNYNAKYQLEEVFHTDYRSCDLRNTVIMYKFNEKRK